MDNRISSLCVKSHQLRNKIVFVDNSCRKRKQRHFELDNIHMYVLLNGHFMQKVCICCYVDLPLPLKQYRYVYITVKTNTTLKRKFSVYSISLGPLVIFCENY